MIGVPINYINPYSYESERKADVIKVNRTRKSNKRGKKAKEQTRLRDKANSPGVPPNTCPYIDMAKTIMDDMAAAYERLYEKGEHQPKFDDLKQLADDQLEYIRRANECLRDNSAYWYNKYKELL